MELEDLYRAYLVARKHNRRSEDMVAFEVDLYANLVRLCEQINSRSYAPLHNYSFMHRRSQRPREVFAAEPELKIMMAYALMRLTPIIEKHLSPRTFNNRVGMGMQKAVNTLAADMYAVSKGYTKPCWVIKIDYKGYFPSMRRDLAWKMVRELTEKEYHGQDKKDVLYCLEMACFCDPKNSRRKSPIWEWADYPSYKSVYLAPDGIGGSIGFTFWQMIASLYPAEIDKWMAKNMSPHFVRYVDDTTIVTDNKEMVLAQIPELRRRLAGIGIQLHPHKFYCQPLEHGVEFLGYRVFKDRIHLKRRTINRAFRTAASQCRGTHNYIDAMNSYLGIIKATSDLKQGRALLDSIKRKHIVKDYENFKVSHDGKRKVQ